MKYTVEYLTTEKTWKPIERSTKAPFIYEFASVEEAEAYRQTDACKYWEDFGPEGATRVAPVNTKAVEELRQQAEADEHWWQQEGKKSIAREIRGIKS